MLLAKIIDAKGRTLFAEVVKVGSVLFDPRPGWVLLRTRLDKPARKRHIEWKHPEDVLFVWVRHFSEESAP